MALSIKPNAPRASERAHKRINQVSIKTAPQTRAKAPNNPATKATTGLTAPLPGAPAGTTDVVVTGAGGALDWTGITVVDGASEVSE